MRRLLQAGVVALALLTGSVLAAQDFGQSTDTTTQTTTDTVGESTTNVAGDIQQTDNAGSFSGTVTTSGSSHEETHSESSSSSVSFGAAPSAASGSPFAFPAAPQPRAHGKNSCSVPNNHQCSGCAISCPDDKQASCTGSDRGIFTGEDDTICATRAKCLCK